MVSCVKNKITYVDYYPNGSLKIKGYRCQNKFCDSLIGYYNNGEILFRGYYKNSKQEGRWKYFHMNGKKQSIKEFRNGELTMFNYWDINGQQTILNGTGVAYVYGSNGKIEISQQYSNNLISGETIEYDTLGIIKSKVNFKDGFLMSDSNSVLE
jgi:antitoxin component YwqK of YwqJK toxin-antitoxin module